MIETAELPRIVISAEDLDRLQNVADAAKNTVPHIAECRQEHGAAYRGIPAAGA